MHYLVGETYAIHLHCGFTVKSQVNADRLSFSRLLAQAADAPEVWQHA